MGKQIVIVLFESCLGKINQVEFKWINSQIDRFSNGGSFYFLVFNRKILIY
jgi:hypothetical protein